MSRTRRGYVMAELMLVVTALTVVFGLAAALLHTLLRIEGSERNRLALAATRDRLARQLRVDVRAAHRAKVDASPGGGLELTGAGRPAIRYEARLGSLVRREMNGSAGERAELYRLRSMGTPRFQVRREDGAEMVVLSLPNPRAPGDGAAPPALEFVAQLGRDGRLAPGKERGQ